MGHEVDVFFGAEREEFVLGKIAWRNGLDYVDCVLDNG